MARSANRINARDSNPRRAKRTGCMDMRDATCRPAGRELRLRHAGETQLDDRSSDCVRKLSRIVRALDVANRRRNQRVPASGAATPGIEGDYRDPAEFGRDGREKRILRTSG